MNEIDENPKLIKLLDAASMLFIKYGFKKVTIEEICKKANVSKMTFYKYFPNKTAIAKAMLEELFDHQMDTMKKIMTLDIPIPEKIQTMVQTKISDIQKYGFGFNFIKEVLGDMDPELTEFIEEKNQWFQNQIKKLILEEQKKGTISRDINVDFVIHIIFRIRESFKDETIIKMFPDVTAMIKEMYKVLFYGIMGK